jgi:hypothetical protein
LMKISEALKSSAQQDLTIPEKATSQSSRLSVAACQIAVHVTTEFDAPFLCGEINMHDSKWRCVAIGPFKIVH